MSLGEITKCDLSYDSAIIDRTELIKCLQSNLCMLRNSLISELSVFPMTNADVDKIAANMSSTGNKSMLRKVQTMSATAELLHTITNSASRTEVTFFDGD